MPLAAPSRWFAHGQDLAELPIIPATDWKKSQKLNDRGWSKLGYKVGDRLVFPSEKLLDSLPSHLKTADEKKKHIKVSPTLAPLNTLP